MGSSRAFCLVIASRMFALVTNRHSAMSVSRLLHPDKRTLISGFCPSAKGQSRPFLDVCYEFRLTPNFRREALRRERWRWAM